MNYICIKNIEQKGISFVCDIETNEVFYVERVYPEGSKIIDEEILELSGYIEDLWKNISSGE